jgi:ATP synthase subunit 6
MKLLCSPLEQFQILPVLPFRIGTFDFSVTNSTVLLLIGLVAFCFILKNAQVLGSPSSTSLTSECRTLITPTTRWVALMEMYFGFVVSLTKDTAGEKGQKYFPYIFALFSFVLVSNLLGLIPFSFTVTSHLIVTFSLATLNFIGINLICVREHKHRILSLFLPAGSSLPLAAILVPIEIVSYFVRPISLSVRLFANMMAGHTLLKVIAGFAWGMVMSGGLFLIAHFVPLFVLVVVMLLETGVAFIQAYVFTVLTCIYLNDALNLH